MDRIRAKLQERLNDKGYLRFDASIRCLMRPPVNYPGPDTDKWPIQDTIFRYCASTSGDIMCNFKENLRLLHIRKAARRCLAPYVYRTMYIACRDPGIVSSHQCGPAATSNLQTAGNLKLILGGGYCGMVKHVRLHAIYAENPLASFTEIWSCMSGKAAWDHVHTLEIHLTWTGYSSTRREVHQDAERTAGILDILRGTMRKVQRLWITCQPEDIRYCELYACLAKHYSASLCEYVGPLSGLMQRGMSFRPLRHVGLLHTGYYILKRPCIAAESITRLSLYDVVDISVWRAFGARDGTQAMCFPNVHALTVSFAHPKPHQVAAPPTFATNGASWTLEFPKLEALCLESAHTLHPFPEYIRPGCALKRLTVTAPLASFTADFIDKLPLANFTALQPTSVCCGHPYTLRNIMQRLDRGSTTNRTYLAIHDGNAFATMGALVGTSLNELYLSVAVRAETLATFVSMAPCLERLTATNILAATFPVEDHTRFAAGPSNLMRLKPLSTTMKALTIRFSHDSNYAALVVYFCEYLVLSLPTLRRFQLLDYPMAMPNPTYEWVWLYPHLRQIQFVPPL